MVRLALGLVLATSAAAGAPNPAAATVIPAGRVELHVHLDGSLGHEELYKVCRDRGISLDGHVPKSAAEVEQYLLSIQPTWHRFDVVNDIVGGNAAVISSIAEAFVEFQARSGVVYTEVRYDPFRLARSGLLNVTISLEDTVRAVQKGLATGAARHGVAVHQILCAMRGQSASRCLETAHLAARTRDGSMGGVVGLDLAGDESTYPNGPYVDCFRYAKRALGLNTTIHAGEFPDTSAVEVRSAVLEMEVDRVGHGYAGTWDNATLRLLEERKVHLEACPKSAHAHGDKTFLAIGVYRAKKMNFGLNTDDPASFIGNTTMAADEVLVRDGLAFTTKDIDVAYSHAFAARFGQVSREVGGLFYA